MQNITPIFYLFFLSTEFIETALVTFVDTKSITYIIHQTQFLKYQQYVLNAYYCDKYMC